MTRQPSVLSNAAILIAATLVAPLAYAEGGARIGEFERASLRIVANATDNDAEIVIDAKPLSDLGLKSLSIFSPQWRKVAEIYAPPRTRGLREFQIETPEPANGQILESYPEGEYWFVGTATNGQVFLGSAEFTHDSPGTTVITAPADEAQIAPGALTIRWAAVPDATRYIVELQNESTDPVQKLTVNVPAGTTSFVVPPSLIVPNSDFQVGVATVHENGNTAVIENAFSTTD